MAELNSSGQRSGEIRGGKKVKVPPKIKQILLLQQLVLLICSRYSIDDGICLLRMQPSCKRGLHNGAIKAITLKTVCWQRDFGHITDNPEVEALGLTEQLRH